MCFFIMVTHVHVEDNGRAGGVCCVSRDGKNGIVRRALLYLVPLLFRRCMSKTWVRFLSRLVRIHCAVTGHARRTYCARRLLYSPWHACTSNATLARSLRIACRQSQDEQSSALDCMLRGSAPQTRRTTT